MVLVDVLLQIKSNLIILCLCKQYFKNVTENKKVMSWISKISSFSLIHEYSVNIVIFCYLVQHPIFFVQNILILLCFNYNNALKTNQGMSLY